MIGKIDPLCLLEFAQDEESVKDDVKFYRTEASIGAPVELLKSAEKILV